MQKLVKLCMQLLGLLGSLKGITSSDYVVSECVLKVYEEGQVQLINKSQSQQFAAHFIINTDQPQIQSCNLATFLSTAEDSPLQRAEWIKYLAVFANLEFRANQVYDIVTQTPSFHFFLSFALLDSMIHNSYLCRSRRTTCAWVELQLARKQTSNQ